MQNVPPCKSYHAVCDDRRRLDGPDGRSRFKVYFVDIIGREDPARTVWADSGMDKDRFLNDLAATEGVAGVGFVTAFAHITKVFRFGPEAETVLNVRAWETRTLTPLSLGRSDGYLEFACLAEALIAADEYRIRAAADSVAAYLRQWSDFADGPVEHADILRQYWHVMPSE